MNHSEALTWETRPWGGFLTVFVSPEHTVKILSVLPGESLSLQYHEHREEFWTLLPTHAGQVKFTINGKVLTAQPHVRYHVPRRVIHRITNESPMTVNILEVIRGRYDENDITRIHDKYGRG